MPMYEINGRKPTIGKNTWIAPSAEIIGDVTIGENCYIGFGAIIRGDFGGITIGNHTLIEEGVVIHCAEKATIGDNVVVGHKAMLHDVTIHNNVLIGMQAMICEHSVINEWSFIAEQSLVLRKQVIPPKKLYGGSPAKEISNAKQRHIDRLKLGIMVYSELTQQYLENFKRID